MSKLILFLLMLCPMAHAGPGYLVWGDSQSVTIINGTADKVWPHIIQQTTGINMQNVSRSGRKLTWDDLPTYMRMANIKPNAEIKGIILALGTNDALRSESMAAFNDSLQEVLVEAGKRKLEVVCILPPHNAWELGGWGNSLIAYREALSTACTEVWDANNWVDIGDMPDGGHFDATGHYNYALGVFWELME